MSPNRCGPRNTAKGGLLRCCSSPHPCANADNRTSVFNPKLDPDEESLETLIGAAFLMRQQLEDVDAKGFALLPEASLDCKYIHLDGRGFYELLKEFWNRGRRGRRRIAFMNPFKPTTQMKPNDAVYMWIKVIFGTLFHATKIANMRRNHDIRYSMMTDGVGASVNFCKWKLYKVQENYVPPSRKKQKVSVAAHVTDLVPGYDYGYKNKSLDSLDQLKPYTVRAVDPGKTTHTCLQQ